MTKHIRLAALLLIFSLFAALFFEASHAGHEATCHQEECPVCLILQVIHNTKIFTGDTAMASGEFFNSYYINILIISAILLPATLVSQKVKLII
jgi:hypothetical protein